MNQAFLLLGSNLGDRIKNLIHCKEMLQQNGVSVKSSSSVYETDPWGNETQPVFYNQAIEIETDLLPQELLIVLKNTETKLGRMNSERWGERLIDIDILYYGEFVSLEDNLTIPHRELANRRFALVPLCEIAADIVHPILKKTNLELLQVCNDSLSVRRIV